MGTGGSSSPLPPETFRSFCLFAFFAPASCSGDYPPAHITLSLRRRHARGIAYPLTFRSLCAFAPPSVFSQLFSGIQNLQNFTKLLSAFFSSFALSCSRLPSGSASLPCSFISKILFRISRAALRFLSLQLPLSSCAFLHVHLTSLCLQSSIFSSHVFFSLQPDPSLPSPSSEESVQIKPSTY